MSSLSIRSSIKSNEKIILCIWMVFYFLTLTYKLGEVPPYHADENFYIESSLRMVESDDYITLDQYIENMKENQTIIYHITGQSIDLVKNSPFLEKLKNNNIECLYMTEPVDEYLLPVLKEYKGHKLISVFKDNFKICIHLL